MILLSAFLIGIGGSLHCIGMCGPIVLALPNNENSKWINILGKLIYNFGRVFSYITIGAIFGLIGNRLLLANLQQVSSIVFGVIIILAAVLPDKAKTKVIDFPIIKWMTNGIKKSFQQVSKNYSIGSMFVIGILNGFLPCGFVYVGAFGAVATGSILYGMLYMLFFGLGTIPSMFLASIAGGFVNTKIKFKVRKLIPVLAVLIGLIFILRGLELGIPLVSPKLQKMATKEVSMQKEAVMDSTKSSGCCSGN